MATATENKQKEAYQVSPVNMSARQKLDIKGGDTVRVTSKIVEKGKTRLQAFEGLVIAAKHGKEAGGTFTVRKVTSGVGVEKIFALYSPLVDKIEIIRRSKTRRAKLYYLRDKTAREIRRKIKNIDGELLSSTLFEEEDAKIEEEAKASEEAQGEEKSEDTEEKEEKETEEKSTEETPAEEEPKEKEEEAPQEDTPEGEGEDTSEKEEEKK